MLRGLYTSWTGMVNEQKRLDVISNNLANSATLGYKQESFYLLDSKGQRIKVGITPHPEDVISFTIDQTMDVRSLTVACLAMNTTRKESAEYGPLGDYTKIQLR